VTMLAVLWQYLPAVVTSLIAALTLYYFSTSFDTSGVDIKQLSSETVLQTFPDWKSTRAVSLWSEHGAVILIVRRPG